MASRGMRWILASAAALALAGCDAFSLLDRLALPDGGGSVGDPVSLSAAKFTAQREETITLTVTGGTAPFTFSVVAQDLSPKTPVPSSSIGNVYKNVDWVYAAGTAIGLIAVTVTDSSVPAASDTVSITVVPPPPSLTATRQSDDDVRIAWSYVQTGAIDGFLIQRSVDYGAFVDLGTFDAVSPASTIDTPVNRIHNIVYRIYAVSGSYKSDPSLAEVPSS